MAAMEITPWALAVGLVAAAALLTQRKAGMAGMVELLAAAAVVVDRPVLAPEAAVVTALAERFGSSLT